MKDDMNSVWYSGRLIADPNFRRIPDTQTAVCDLTVISNRTVTPEKRVAVVVRTTVWGKQAEFLKENLSKGDEVAVIGSLADDNFEEEKGNPETRTSGRVKIDNAMVTIMRKRSAQSTSR